MCHNENSTTPRLIKIATQHCFYNWIYIAASVVSSSSSSSSITVAVAVAVEVAVYSSSSDSTTSSIVVVVVYIKANKICCGMKVGYLR